MKQERVENTLQHLKERNITQLLISNPVSIYYYTNVKLFPGERFLGLLLSGEGVPVLFVNKIFEVKQQENLNIVYLDDTDTIVDSLKKYIRADETLAVEKELTAKFLLPILKSKLAADIVDGSFAVEESRSIKDDFEREAMILSSKINDRAIEKMRQLIRPCVTEKEIADAIPKIYEECGADRTSFAIVAFGKNAADPHHMPDGTVLKEGDCVLLDVGAEKNGYCSDMTRTFFYQSAGEKQQEVYAIVKKANEEAEKFIHPGVTFAEIDGIARNIINENGYGEYFTHRLGHSIGLMVHECGDVSASNNDIVRAGMTFSIEPGIYLPGEFGIRIEDLVLVTEDGCRVLNSYEKELNIITA